MFRLRGAYAYHARRGEAPYPETITLFITWNCNLRCRMCGQWGENGSSLEYSKDTLKRSIPEEVLKRLVDDVRFFKPTITFFGGEPLLYKNMVPIIAHIKARGMRCNMITNGTTLRFKAEELVEAGLDELIFSLDGPEPIHDEIRGLDGTFRRAMEGVKLLQEAKVRMGRRKPVFNVNSTMTAQNFRHLEEMIHVAEDLGAETLTFHHQIYLGSEVYDHHRQVFGHLFGETSPDWAGFVRAAPPAFDVQALSGEVDRIQRTRWKTRVAFYPNYSATEIRRYYGSPFFNPLTYDHNCVSPWLQCYIFPDGGVRACESMNLTFGNINEQPFTEIWNNEGFVKFRADLRERGEYPACNKCTEYYRF